MGKAGWGGWGGGIGEGWLCAGSVQQVFSSHPEVKAKSSEKEKQRANRMPSRNAAQLSAHNLKTVQGGEGVMDSGNKQEGTMS